MTEEGDLREELVKSELVYLGRVLDLSIHTTRLLDGSLHRREVVEHRGSVAIVPQFEDGSIVLVKQYRQAVGKVLLEIPAGTLERGESPDDCALRELVEETGYVAREITRILSCYTAPGYSSEMIHIYHATKLSKSSQNAEEDESIRVVSCRPEEILRMIESGQIEDAKTICGILGLLGNRRERSGCFCQPL